MEYIENMVSIITPMYNSERYIEDMIKSVMNQTYKNWELIIVDDCSNDKGYSVVEKYTKIDSRIKLFKQEVNKGPAMARNFAINKSRGRFISFLDSDDIWMPNKLSIQVNYMIKKAIPFTFTSYGFIDQNGKILKKEHMVNGIYDYDKLLKGNDIGTLSVVIDRMYIENLQFNINKDEFKTRTGYLPIHEDYILWLSILKLGTKAVALNNITCLYRKNNGQVSGNKFNSARATWRIYRRIEKLNLRTAIRLFWYYAIKGIKKHY